MAKCKWPEVEEKLFLIECWARDGLLEKDIAAKLQINISTLQEYKKKYPVLKETLKKGKEQIDYVVENALLKRALGYRYVETTEERAEDGEMYVTKKVVKEMPPDTTAQIFWLKNRVRKKWMDNPQKNALERERLDLEKERVEIEKMRAKLFGIGDEEEENTTGVVTIPAMDMEQYEKEKAAAVAKYEANKAGVANGT